MRKMRSFKKNREKNITHFLFVLPNLIAYSVFGVFPILLGIYYSFTDWNGVSRNYNFIGLKNYVRAFRDSRFINSLLFNIKYTVFLVIGVVVISIFLGMLLNQKIKGKSFFRAAFFFPAVISLLTSGLIFNQIYGKGLPYIGNLLDIEFLKYNILANKTGAQIGILIVHLWQGVAMPTVLIMAALQNVPLELMEAAKLDGASKWQIFKYLTIPFILPTITIIIVLNLKSGLMLYDYVVALTTGGPARATESLTLLIYTQAYDEMKFSYSISESIAVSLVIIAISVLQIVFTNRKKVYG